jgi:HPt (histidine-containing phosphotransfer) domain-containing protein
MTSSPELLRFFQKEAGEYLDAIEVLVLAGDNGIDASAFIAAARALRGSATMARVPRISEIAFALEQIGNAVREGELTWSAALYDALREASADLRALVHATSRWAADDDQRAAERLGALRHFVPNDPQRSVTPTTGASAAPVFIALQSAAIAGDLDAFVAESRNRALLDDIISRVRSLRGIAGAADHPPVSDVADAVEQTLRSLAPDVRLMEQDAELLRAAAAVFRRASADLRSRGRINLASGEIGRFARAAAAPQRSAHDVTQVVRIDDLFYPGAGPHVMHRGEAHGGSADTRFHGEATTRAEHTRRLVADARAALDPISRERATRDLRLNLDRLEGFARSFNAQQIAAFFGELSRGAGPLLGDALDAIDAGAQVLLLPNASIAEMEQRLALMDRKRHTTPSTPPQLSLPAASTHIGHGAKGASGKMLQALLDSSLTGLRSLDETPLSEPARLEDEEIVPIASLLYRGGAALQRALEVRDAMKARGRVDDESLQELYDLLDLARAE